MVNIIYRNYKEDDEKQIVSLFNIAFQQGGGSVRTPKSWLWRYVKSPGFEPEMIQIAEDIDNNKIVGSIIVNLIERIPIGQKKFLIGEINDVATLPNYTKRGIASKLMELSIDFMTLKGCDFSILTAGSNSIARNKLYLKFGYFDYVKENVFFQFPKILQFLRNIYGFAIFFPIIFMYSYLPRFLNRVRIKFNHFFKDFSYEINYNSKHFEYMKKINSIYPKYYEGYPKYNKIKFKWARIEVPSKRYKPTYILIKKDEKIIGGSVITHQNIYASKYGIKIRLGVIHEIFLDKNIFDNSKNLYLGYIYLVDKVIKAATRRSLGVIIYFSPQNDKDLNHAFRGLCFLKKQTSVIMIKELKKSLKFPQIKKPLFIPTYVSLGVP